MKSHSSSPAKRIAKFDNIRAFLIIMVVLGHGLTPFLSSHLIKATTLWLYTYHMPLFVFLGGLFSKKAINGDSFYIPRIVSYLILGFLMKIAVHGTLLLCGRNPAFSWLDEKGVAWYIFAMAAHLVITRLVRKLPHTALLCGGTAFAVAAGYLNFIDDTLVLSKTIVFFPFFYLGYIVDTDKLLHIICRKNVRIASSVFLILFTAGIFLLTDGIYSLRYLFSGNNPYYEFGDDWYFIGGLLRLGGYVLSSLVSFCFMSVMPKREIPFFTIIGTNSLSTYVFHRPVQYALESLFFISLAAALEPITVLLLTLGVSYIISIILAQKPFFFVLKPFSNTKGFLESIKKLKNKSNK